MSCTEGLSAEVNRDWGAGVFLSLRVSAGSMLPNWRALAGTSLPLGGGGATQKGSKALL